MPVGDKVSAEVLLLEVFTLDVDSASMDMVPCVIQMLVLTVTVLVEDFVLPFLFLVLQVQTLTKLKE